MFGRQGNAVAELNGANVYHRELDQLRTGRNIADLFMRNASRIALRAVQEGLKDPDKLNVAEAKRKEMTFYLDTIEKDLSKRLRQPRYFEGGVKLEELLDFMLWLQEADRLGINLQPEAVDALVLEAVHSRFTGVSQSHSRQAGYEVRRTNSLANHDL